MAVDLTENSGLFERLKNRDRENASPEYSVYEEPEIVVGAVCYTEDVPTVWEKIKQCMHDNGVNLDYALFSTYPALVRAVKNDIVDVGWVTPLAYVQLRETIDEVNVLGMRDVDREFTSVVFTEKSSEISSVHDLEGKTLALGSRDSAQANILTRYYLEQQVGLEVAARSDRDTLTDGAIRPVQFDADIGKHGCTGESETAVAEAVRSGEADAGAIGATVYESFVESGLLDESKYERVWESPGYSHCNFCAKASFSEEKARAFYQTLAQMDSDDPDHREILDLEGCEEWVPGTKEGYADLKAATDLV